MLNRELLKEMIDGRFVNVQKHIGGDLFIYNYTPSAQWNKMWNEVTLQCRGLILDGDYNIIARPFKKFFNYEELTPEQIPAERFEVFDKLDGSLGILYWFAGKPFVATRGSFTSEQAVEATKILYSKYKDSFERFQKDRTYLFEIIYPENRIVVDYADTRDIILLAVIDNATGCDLPLEDIGFPIVKRYDGIKDISMLREKEEPNSEGFVIRFESGLRLKLKYAEYVRLHRILTQVSSKSIWELLSSNEPLTTLLEKVPDEFFQWVKNTESSLRENYSQIEKEAMKSFKILDTRKDTALYFQTQKHRPILFAMLDKKDYSHIIWKSLKPEYERPFKLEI